MQAICPVPVLSLNVSQAQGRVRAVEQEVES